MEKSREALASDTRVANSDLIILECMYCGHKEEIWAHQLEYDNQPKCHKCGDTKLRAHYRRDEKIDTYGKKVGPNNDDKGDGWNKW